MQSLAAYSFEASVDDTKTRLSALNKLIDNWLLKKGAETPHTTDGAFTSKPGDGAGQFSRRTIQSQAGSLQEIELIETAHTGAMFTTSIQIASSGKRVVVYATLSATPGESRIAPIALYPRCPHVIRSMIESFPDWIFNGQDVPLARAFDATESQAAKVLCDILRSNTRRFPILVVSNDEDEAVWENFQERAAEHLVGLADVAFVNAESSWVLTDELGPRDSCYLGAVRLYWPGLRQDGSLSGINWLASRLSSFGTDDTGRNKFLAILRKEIMSVAALTITPPKILGEIRSSAEKARLLALEQGARDSELDSIIEENARYLAELEKAQKTIQSLQWKLVYATQFNTTPNAANDEKSEEESEANTTHTPPKSGETRFYKKIGSGGGVDTLIQTKACNHKESNWKPAFKGDQAEKGLLKLEGQNSWKSIAHCSACTGGGRWRVNW